MRDRLQEQLSESEHETRSTQHRLERRIDELMGEKDDAVTAVRNEAVQAAQLSQSGEKVNSRFIVREHPFDF